MLELLLFRHAKSRRDEAGVEDHDRDLDPRGERDAPRMGALIAAEGTVPDLVLCSTAKRARRTWELAAGSLGAPAPEPVTLRELYLAPPDRMLEVVRARGGGARRVMLVGHNPGLQELASLLAGEGDVEARRSLGEKLPTGALVRLSFEAEGWGHVAPRLGRLSGFWRPRDLR